MPPLAAVLPQILLSIAISAALTIISRLLAPQQQQQRAIGPQLPVAREPGVELTLRAAGEPHQLVFGRRRVKGNIVFFHCNENNKKLHLAIEWTGHLVANLGGMFFDDEEVPIVANVATGKYADVVRCYDNLGGDDQVAISAMLAACSDVIDDKFRGQGKAWSYIQLTWNREKFPQGLPNIWRIVDGFPVYDPRDESTGWSANAILCAAAFMNNKMYGRGISYGGLNGINIDGLIAAANICDEDVEKEDGTTEKRYECHGVLTSDTEFEENLRKLLSACAGSMTPIGGSWIPEAAAWEAPELIFDEDDFLEPFEVQNGMGAADSFNAIKGKYANPDKNYQPDDFPAITSSVYEVEDGGAGDGDGRVFKDISLDCTVSPFAAQRLARIDLRRARQPLTFEAKFKLRALQTTPGRNIAINFGTPLFWELKTFRVERMKLIVGFGPDGQGDKQPGIIGASLTLRETAEEIFDWDASIDEQGVDITPNTNAPNVFECLPPSNLTAIESIYLTRTGGGVKAKVTLSCVASPDAFVQDGGGYQFEYGVVEFVHADDPELNVPSVWYKLPVTSDTTTEIPDIKPGIYGFRVAAINVADIPSEYVTIPSKNILGLSAPPSPPTGFTVSAKGNGTLAMAYCDYPVDLDVQQGGNIVFRHSSLMEGATWADGISLSDPLPATSGQWMLPLKSGTYMAKFRDSTGQHSSMVSFVQTQSSVHEFIAAGSVSEDPDFTGVHEGTEIRSGALEMTRPFQLGDPDEGWVFGDPDDDYSFGEPVILEATYTFANVLDLASLKRVRLTTDLVVEIINGTDVFNARSGSVRMWPSFKGDVEGSEADAVIYVRTTQTDPSGSPLWTAWERLDASDFEMWAAEFKALLTRTDDSYSARIEELGVVAEEVA